MVLRGIPRASSEISKDFQLSIVLFSIVDHCYPSLILTLENAVAPGHFPCHSGGFGIPKETARTSREHFVGQSCVV